MSKVTEFSIHSKVYGTKVAKIDAEDFPLISSFKWYVRISYSGTFYATNRKTRKHMHWMVLGEPPKGMVIDHIDGDGLNNCRSNLRFTTHQQNMYNSKARKNSTSTFKGVYWNKEKSRWTCQIKAGDKHKHIGHFLNEIDAAKAYNEKAAQLHGMHARLNPV